MLNLKFSDIMLSKVSTVAYIAIAILVLVAYQAYTNYNKTA